MMCETHHVLRQDLTKHIWTFDHIDFNVEPVDDLDGQFSDKNVLYVYLRLTILISIFVFLNSILLFFLVCLF